MSPKNEDTVQEIVDIVSAKRFAAGIELLEMRFLIGEALLQSPRWKRDTRMGLLAEAGEKAGLGERSLRYCAEFFEKYETWENVMSYADPDHKLPVWRDIVRGLPSGSPEKIEEEQSVRCKKCPFHCHEED